MILEYTVTKKDYENVIYSDLKKKTKGGRLGCAITVFGTMMVAIIVFVFILMLTSEYSLNPLIFLPVLILFLPMLLASVFTNKRVLAKLSLRERIKSGGVDRQYFGPHTLEVKGDRLLLRYGNTEGERLYGGIDHIAEYKGAVAIFLSSVSCDIIPNAAFKDTEERHSFISLIQSKMAAAKDVPIAGEKVDESRLGAKYTVDYSWDEQALIDALIAGNRLIFKTRLMWTPGRVIITILGLLLLFLGITMIGEVARDIGSDFVRVYIGAIIFCLLISTALLINYVMVFTPWIRSIVTKQIRNGAVQRDMVGNHTMCVYEDKVKIFSRLSSQDINMEQIYCISQQSDTLHFLLKAKVIIPVPASAFQSDDILKEVVAFIESKIKKK